MATLTSFFGGGGGGTPAIDPVNPTFLRNVTFATNTQFAVSPTDQRGTSPISIPCTDTTFFLLEGNSTSDIYVSYWELDSNGAATQLATALQITGCDEVASAAANGVNRLMLVGGNNYDTIYGIHYNGTSTLTQSTVRSSSQTYQSLATCTCTLDGTLIGCISSNSGNQSIAYTAAILLDGTVLTGSVSTGFERDNYSRLIGTEQGLMGVGKRVDASNRFASCKISVQPDNSSSLLAINSNTYTLIMNGNFNTSNNNPPFIVPTQGGIRALYVDLNQRLFDFVVNSRDAKMLNLNTSLGDSSASGAAIANQTNMASEFLNGIGSTFSRQANGTWLVFKGASSSVQYTLFSDIPSFRTPFSDLPPIGDDLSSGCTSKVSTSLVGNFVVSTWYDETDGDVNIDTWNFRG